MRSTLKTISGTEIKFLKEWIKDLHRQRYQLTEWEAELDPQIAQLE